MSETLPRRRKGTVGAPPRERPDDFRDQFVRIGWDTVDHYATGWKIVSRWLDEEGRAAVLADRRAYKQMMALQDRFAVIVDNRSPTVAYDFIAAVAEYAARHSSSAAARAQRPGM